MTDDIVIWGIGTPRTLRAYWALEELGVAYESRTIRTRTTDMDDPDFLQVSPGQKIPAMQHGELSITESGAITRYLMDNFSNENWTAHEQAQTNRWILFSLMEIDATALYVVRRYRGLPEIYGEAPAAVSSSLEYARRQLNVINEWLSDGRSFMLGERFSEADIHVTSCLGWAEVEGIALPEYLSAYRGRLTKRPAYNKATTINFPKP